MMNIYFIGYQPRYFWRKKHTNYWPWNYLVNTINELGYRAFHVNAQEADHSKPAVYICWNTPDTITLIDKYKIHPESIIIQKLTSFDGTPESAQTDWTDNPEHFFKNWHWPQYQKLDVLNESGYRFYAFGARTDSDSFPEKKKIVDKYKERIFWIPWGTMTAPYHEIMKAKPVMKGFEYDLGFVGSKWGSSYRGNILEWETYLQPLIDKVDHPMIAGRGTKIGPVSVEKHIEILQKSKICPIIHASSWKIEKGIMDRFWTVFSLGRFGVMDNEGILDFYNEDEVVLATDREEYLDKSMYYIRNVDRQLPYIEKVMKRIKTEYNQNQVWKKIFEKIFSE